MQFFFLFTLIFLFSCDFKPSNKSSIKKPQIHVASNIDSIINPEGIKIIDRFLPPKNFVREGSKQGSFSHYLRTLPLKPHDSYVHYYDGGLKQNRDVYVAVIDMEIGHKDLHQCADAIMRLKADYHWQNKSYEKIRFSLTNGDMIAYKTWMEGKRVMVKGNQTLWIDKYSPSNTYKDFWSYLEFIFMYAGTASLEKELVPIDLKDMRIGDVFIKGGFPGHAVMVIDMATNPETKEKVFMMGQSYMPAQEFQVLANNNEEEISPWYTLSEIETIETPEWSFTKSQLKRWPE